MGWNIYKDIKYWGRKKGRISWDINRNVSKKGVSWDIS